MSKHRGVAGSSWNDHCDRLSVTSRRHHYRNIRRTRVGVVSEMVSMITSDNFSSSFRLLLLLWALVNILRHILPRCFHASLIYLAPCCPVSAFKGLVHSTEL